MDRRNLTELFEALELLVMHKEEVIDFLEKNESQIDVSNKHPFNEWMQKKELSSSDDKMKKEMQEPCSRIGNLTEWLTEMGLPRRLTGFDYLHDAIMMWRDIKQEKKRNPLIVKDIYQGIAKKYNTNPKAAERNIRTAVGIIWKKGDRQKLQDIFKSTISPNKCKPKNSEFISMIGEKLD